MIFKTFDSDKDTFSSKFGILGKSFEDIRNRFKKVSDELIVTNDYTISNIANAWKNSSVKKNLSDKFIITKSDIQDKLKDLSVYEKNPQGILDNLLEQKELVDYNQSSWQKYFEGLAEGEKWQAKFVQENDLTKVSLDDVKNAQNAAKQSAIAYNNGLKQMTIGAKAANIAMKGLALVGNMLALYLLTKVITAYSDYKNKIHEIADESSKQASQSSEYVTKLNDLQKELKNGTKSSDELTSAFKEQLLTMGYTESEIDNLIVKYNGLAGAISAATEEALKNARKDAYVDVASTSKALEVDSNGGFINDILIEKKTTGIKELDKQINELMSDYATFSADGGNKWIPKDSSAEGLYNYYNSLKKVSELIQDTASQTNNNDLLNQGNFFNHTLLGEVTDAMYNTSSDAFKTIKDALESGQVGSDDMRAAMELLMSQDKYKEFLKAGHSEEDALEKQYLFMEKWADTNKKFFGDDMKQNAINFFEYLDKTGLLADGVLATSEEIGKQTGLSVDAVNSLIQFGNMYGFQDIIQQSQIDYVDDYVEKMQNLQSAKEAFQQANESDPNSNITLGLKDDLSNAQKELDDFYADIPKKFNDISEEYMNTTTDKSLGEYFTEQMGGDDNTLAYMQSIGDRLKYIDQEKNRLSVQNKDKGIFSTSQYKALEDEESVLKSIQEQLETSNDTYQKAIANTDEYVKLVAKKKNIQKAMSQSGSDSEIKQLSGELSEVQGQLDALSAPTQIQLSLDKSEVESEIQSVTNQIERLTSMSNSISLKINQGDTSAGAYQALNAINNAKNTAQNQKADLQGKLADIETTIKYVADTTEIDEAKDSIPDNTDSNVTFKVNGLSELERARNILSQLQSKTIDINIRANTAGVSAANWGKNGMSSDVPIAHVEGTAHADGNWGLKKDENGSLVGELGTERIKLLYRKQSHRI